ncbi:MAG: ribokinase [Planctomycetota bacterium]|nr:ribokinase [Planctomycetota bacterium]MDA1164884.1 ribokinase [Planctomycetota bacterium]
MFLDSGRRSRDNLIPAGALRCRTGNLEIVELETRTPSVPNPKIIVLGSVNTDLVVSSPRLPAAGETVMGGNFYKSGGGKGANQAVAAARTSGLPVGFIAAVGNDDFGRHAIRQFRSENMLTQHIRMVDDYATGVALIMVDEYGENQISVASGANAALSPDDVAAIDDAFFSEASVFVACLESPIETVIAGLKRAKEAGLKTILNPAPASEEACDRELLQLVDVLTPNESEATFLSGWDEMKDLEDACIWCEQLQQRGSRRIIITRGDRGCILKEESSDVCLTPAFVVEAVDATAAGDCFNGALATGLAEGRTLLEAARFAMAAAAISVTRRGAIPSLPTREEVLQFLASDPQRSEIRL